MVLGSGCCVGKLFGGYHLLTHSLLYLFHSLYVCADVCVYVRICVCACAYTCVAQATLNAPQESQVSGVFWNLRDMWSDVSGHR